VKKKVCSAGTGKMGGNNSSQTRWDVAAPSILTENRGKSFLCSSELRDPLTRTVSFMVNPSPFRQCCRFTVECWDHAIYLEGELSCPTVLGPSLLTSLVESTNVGARVLGSAPMTQKNISKHHKVVSNLRFFNIPQLSAGVHGWMMGFTSLIVIHFEKLPGLTSVEAEAAGSGSALP
jgi:hypothetical protein